MHIEVISLVQRLAALDQGMFFQTCHSPWFLITRESVRVGPHLRMCCNALVPWISIKAFPFLTSFPLFSEAIRIALPAASDDGQWCGCSSRRMVYFTLVTDNVLASNPLPDPGCDLWTQCLQSHLVDHRTWHPGHCWPCVVWEQVA